MDRDKIIGTALLTIALAFAVIAGLIVTEVFESVHAKDDAKNCQKLDGEFIVVYKKEMPLLEEPFEVFECKKVKK